MAITFALAIGSDALGCGEFFNTWIHPSISEYLHENAPRIQPGETWSSFYIRLHDFYVTTPSIPKRSLSMTVSEVEAQIAYKVARLLDTRVGTVSAVALPIYLASLMGESRALNHRMLDRLQIQATKRRSPRDSGGFRTQKSIAYTCDMKTYEKLKELSRELGITQSAIISEAIFFLYSRLTGNEPPKDLEDVSWRPDGITENWPWRNYLFRDYREIE